MLNPVRYDITIQNNKDLQPLFRPLKEKNILLTK